MLYPLFFSALALATPPTIKTLNTVGTAPMLIDTSWQIESSAGGTVIAGLLAKGAITLDCRDDFPPVYTSLMSSYTVPRRILLIDVADTTGAERTWLAGRYGFSASWFNTLLADEQAYVVAVAPTLEQIAVFGGGAAGLQHGVIDMLKSSEVYDSGGARSCQLIGKDWRSASTAVDAFIVPVNVLNYPDVDLRVSSQRLMHVLMREDYCSLTPTTTTAATWLDECVLTGVSNNNPLQSDLIAVQLDQAVWNQYNFVADVTTSSSFLHSNYSVDPGIPDAADKLTAVIDYLADRNITYIPSLFPIHPNTDSELYGEDWNGTGYRSPGADGDVSLAEGLGAEIEATAVVIDGSTYYEPDGYTLTDSGDGIVLDPDRTIPLEGFEGYLLGETLCDDLVADGSDPVTLIRAVGAWFSLSEKDSRLDEYTCDSVQSWKVKSVSGDQKLCASSANESMRLRLSHFKETSPEVFDSGGLYVLGLELSGTGTLLISQSITDTAGVTDLSGDPAGLYPSETLSQWGGEKIVASDDYESLVFRVPGGSFAEDAEEPAGRLVHHWIDLRATDSEVCIDDVQIIPVSGQFRNVADLTLTATSAGADYTGNIDYTPTDPQPWSAYLDPDHDPDTDDLLDAITGTLTAPVWSGGGTPPSRMTFRYASQTAFGHLNSSTDGEESLPYIAVPTPDPSAIASALVSIGYGSTYSSPFLAFGALDELRGINRAWTQLDAGRTDDMTNAEWLAGVVNAMDVDSCSILGGCSGTRTELRPLLWADMFSQHNNGGDPLYQLPHGGRTGESWSARDDIPADAVLSVWAYGDQGSSGEPAVGMESIMADVDDLTGAGFDLLGTPWCGADNAQHWAAVATSPDYPNMLGLLSPEWGNITTDYEEMEQMKGLVAHVSWNAQVSLLEFWYGSDQPDWPGGVEFPVSPLIEAYGGRFEPVGMSIGGAIIEEPGDGFTLTAVPFGGVEFEDSIELRFYARALGSVPDDVEVTLRALDGSGGILLETTYSLTFSADLDAYHVNFTPLSPASYEVEFFAPGSNSDEVLIDSIALYQQRALVPWPTYAGGLSFTPEMSGSTDWSSCTVTD